MGERKLKPKIADVIPLFGRDEMNLAELAFGPISPCEAKTREVQFSAYDKSLKRPVTRQIIITGSDAYGLPKPIDDQVLLGLKALTYEAGFATRKIPFSGYRLCRTLGWPADGRSYQRLEKSIDRIGGTSLKFKDAWFDKGKKEWVTEGFHLIDNYRLCTRNQLDRSRIETGRREAELCSVTWNDVIWKSFQDGNIKKLDMEMYRRITRRRKSEVAQRLFRLLDKRFHNRSSTTINDLRDLCERHIGLSSGYSLAQLVRIMNRAVNWLIECEYLASVDYKEGGNRRTCGAVFRKYQPKHSMKPSPKSRRIYLAGSPDHERKEPSERTDELKDWIESKGEAICLAAEAAAVEQEFGSSLERKIVAEGQRAGKSMAASCRIRQGYVRRYLEAQETTWSDTLSVAG